MSEQSKQGEAKASHTPGPWHFTMYGNVTTSQSNWFVQHGSAAPADWVANARLVAAAPDLLAACRAWQKVRQHQITCAMNGYDSVDTDLLQEYLSEANRLTNLAIAKAEGSAAQ